MKSIKFNQGTMHIYNAQCSVVNRKLENLKYLTESREQWNYKAFFFDL